MNFSTGTKFQFDLEDKQQSYDTTNNHFLQEPLSSSLLGRFLGTLQFAAHLTVDRGRLRLHMEQTRKTIWRTNGQLLAGAKSMNVQKDQTLESLSSSFNSKIVQPLSRLLRWFNILKMVENWSINAGLTNLMTKDFHFGTKTMGHLSVLKTPGPYGFTQIHFHSQKSRFFKKPCFSATDLKPEQREETLTTNE